MRLLFLQFTDPTAGESIAEFSHCLGVLAAMLKADGFEPALSSLGGYRPDQLHKAIISHRPQYILAEIGLHSIAPARRTITDIAGRFALPVVVCGKYATCKPAEAISTTGTRAVLLGEYEQAGLAFFRAVRDGGDPGAQEGLWFKSESGLAKGAVGELVEDLDSLPAPDRELFDYQRIVDASGEAQFEVARGCQLWCGTCINDLYMDLYDGKGTFCRRRSVSNVLDEIEAVLDRYCGVRRIRFSDPNFAADLDWLRRFADEYPRRFSLAFHCHVQLRNVTDEVASLLAAGGCKWVHTYIGSGSRFIREEIQSMHIDDDQIIAACRSLRSAGMELSGEVDVGLPYESAITFEDTVRLLRRAKVDCVLPRVYYPTPGTRAAERCRENGWISGRGEENYWRGRSVLDMASMPAKEIDMLADKLKSMVRSRIRPTLQRLRAFVRRGASR